MPKVTIEFETSYPDQVLEAYIIIKKLLDYHYPEKKDEGKKSE